MRTTIFINQNEELNYDSDAFKLYNSRSNSNITIDCMMNREPVFVKYQYILEYTNKYKPDEEAEQHLFDT